MANKEILIGLAVAALFICALSEDSVDYTLFDSKEATDVITESAVKESISRWNDGKACDEDKKCVSFHLCSENNEIITDGQFMIDERLGEDEAQKCDTYKVCCRKKDVTPPGIKQICSNYKTAKNCGLRNTMGVGTRVKAAVPSKIKYSQYGEFPWSMAVMNNTEKIPKLLCGGTLIHPKVVISAAHSIARMSDIGKILVRGGEYNTQTTDEICPHADRKVKSVLIHEQFIARNLQNSISMIVLTQAFVLSPTINIICLPPAGMSFEGDSCIACGWGKSDFMSTTKYQVFPKFIELGIVSNEECQELLRATRLGEDFVLHENFLCAGGDKGVDTCTGDGGSALVCENKEKRNHYYFAAVVVGGVGCGSENVPGFYSDIAKHREWIDGHMQRLGLQ